MSQIFQCETNVSNPTNVNLLITVKTKIKHIGLIMIDFVLTRENRLNLNRDAGNLIHAFGEGYFIIDEYGREVNTFNDEAEFNRLIEKFRYREFLINRLSEVYADKFRFREDNVLFINNEPVKECYWNLPKNDGEVELFFDFITNKFKTKLQSK